MSGVIWCPIKCWGCKFGDHDPTWHTWADLEDVDFARGAGKPDPSDQQCGCYCQRGVTQ